MPLLKTRTRITDIWSMGISGGVCIQQGTDGTKYGYSDGNFGSMDPHETDGHLLIEISYQANGLFIVRYEGGVKITDLDEIKIIGLHRAIETHWNETNGQYEGSDVDLAAELIDAFVDGEKLCFELVFDLPDLFLHYDFSQIVQTETI